MIFYLFQDDYKYIYVCVGFCWYMSWPLKLVQQFCGSRNWFFNRPFAPAPSPADRCQGAWSRISFHSSDSLRMPTGQTQRGPNGDPTNPPLVSYPNWYPTDMAPKAFHSQPCCAPFIFEYVAEGKKIEAWPVKTPEYSKLHEVDRFIRFPPKPEKPLFQTGQKNMLSLHPLGAL